MRHRARWGAAGVVAISIAAGVAIFSFERDDVARIAPPSSARASETPTLAVEADRTDDAAGAVSGTLVDAVTGDALPDKHIIFNSESPNMQLVGRSDAAGYFFLTGVAPGKLTASLAGDEYVLTPESASIVVTTRSPTETVELRATKRARDVAPPDKTTGEAAAQSDKGGKIRGILVNARGQPVQGVEVSARVIGAGRTDKDNDHSAEDGSFHLEELGSGEYRLSVSRYNFSSIEDEVTRVRLRKNETVAGLRIVVPEMGQLSIAGRVEDTRGRPIARAQVSLSGRGGFISDESDAEGKFHFERLKEGSLGISASRGDFSDSPEALVLAGAFDVTIVLKDLAIVEGRVVSAATGQPVTAFAIAIFDGYDPSYSGIFASTPKTTEFQDADGRFVLADVKDGANALTVKAEGFAPATMDIARVSGGENRRDVLVKMGGGANLTGRVIDAAGKPVVGAEIFAGGHPASFFTPAQPDAKSVGDGTFQLTSLKAGGISFSVHHPDFAEKSVETRVSPNIDNRIDVVMTGGGAIEGLVTLDGKPWPKQKVHAGGDTQETDGLGRYRIAGLAVGTAYVDVSMKIGGVQREQDRRVTIRDGFTEQLNFAFESGTSIVEGTIFEDERGPLREPTPVGVTMGSGMESGETFTTESDTSGHYAIQGLPAGMAHIIIEVGETQYAFPVEVAPNAHLRKNLYLYGGGNIRVRLSGRSASSYFAPIILMSGTVEIDKPSEEMFVPGIWPVVRTVYATGGEAVLKGIEPGTYTIVAIAFGASGNSSPDDPFAITKCVTRVIEVKKDEELDVELEL